jgi:hypothetical protein
VLIFGTYTKSGASVQQLILPHMVVMTVKINERLRTVCFPHVCDCAVDTNARKFTPLWMAENSLCDVEVGERWHGASELTFVVKLLCTIFHNELHVLWKINHSLQF